jgi:hypothetical protein
MTTCCITVCVRYVDVLLALSFDLQLQIDRIDKPGPRKDESMTPEFEVVRAAPTSAVAVETAAATNRTTKRLLVIVATILECLIICIFSFRQEQMEEKISLRFNLRCS